MKPLLLLLVLMQLKAADIDKPEPLDPPKRPGPWREFVNETLQDHDLRIWVLEAKVTALKQLNHAQTETISAQTNQIQDLTFRVEELENRHIPQPASQVVTYAKPRCRLFWRWRRR